MGLLPIAVVLVAGFGLVTSAVLAMAQRRVLAFLGTIEPAARTRWLTALLAAPCAVGVVLLALALAPCAMTFLVAGLDDCRSHADLICRLCIAHPMHATAIAWVLAAACLLPPVRAVARAVGAARGLRRVARRLRLGARVDAARATWWVPGAASFVVGWPRGAICLGEDLAAQLGPRGLAAVAAHEAAHLRRGDVHRKLAARVLAATHMPRVGRALLDALDLAIEQACDAAAADAVRDPLVVADALIRVARLESRRPAEVLAALLTSSLDARIAALCAPDWRPSGRVAAALALLGVATAGLGLAFDQAIHHAAETLVSLLG